MNISSGRFSVSGANALITSANALVSGATGFLGGRLISHLQDAGFRVRVLVRPGSNTEALSNQGVELFRGDLTDEASLNQAVADQHYVFHTAGKVSDWGKRCDFFKTNVGGTENLLAACRKNSVKRLVHISSLTVLGLPRDGALINENTPITKTPKDPYSASKLAAEVLARAAHGQNGLEVTIIRPGVIWGEGDVTILPRLARLLLNGRLVYIGSAENTLALSHVDNLCHGIIQAATTPGAAGQTYHLTDGEEITAKLAIKAIAKALNVQAPRYSFPFGVVFLTAAILEAAARLTGKKTAPLMTRYGVRLMACHSRYDISKARNEIGYHPVNTFQTAIGYLEMAGEEK